MQRLYQKLSLQIDNFIISSFKVSKLKEKMDF